MKNIILSSRKLKQDIVTLTDIFSETAVYVEGIVTKLVIRIGRLKQETVGAKLFFWDFSDAFIIFITLFWVWEKSVWFRTFENLT